MSETKANKKSLQHIFSYKADMFEGLSRAEARALKTEIVEQFWAEWGNNPNVISLLEEVSNFTKLHALKFAHNQDQMDKLYSETMEAILRPFPFYDPEKSKITAYLKKRIEGSVVDIMRKEYSEIGVSRDTTKALGKISEVERSLGEEFNLSNPRHMKCLNDMGFSQTTISNLGKIPSFLSLDDTKNDKSRTHDNVKDEKTPDPSEYIEQSQFLEKLEDIIRGLSERQRQIFTLHHIEQFSQREIASQLGVSQSAISQTLSIVNIKITDGMEIDARYLNKRNKSQKARNTEPEHSQPEHSQPEHSL